MHTEPQNEQKTTQQSRRQFLTRTTAGVVIAALPAKSVWATTGGIAQSIVASGNSSDFAGGKRIELYSMGWVKKKGTEFHNLSFQTVFGGLPFNKNGGLCASDMSFIDILKSNSSTNNGYQGPSNVNKHLIAVYCSAVLGAEKPPKIFYPVVGSSPAVDTSKLFAEFLYNKCGPNGLYAATVGQELKQIICEYHIDTYMPTCDAE